MSAILWIVAAAMQLCAVLFYSVVGLGLAFALCQIFVLLTFALTAFSIWVKTLGAST